jgi:hypothetical protein
MCAFLHSLPVRWLFSLQVTCDKDPNFATLYPTRVSLQEDVFISQLTIDSSLSTDFVEIETNKTVVYPNPTAGKVYINSNQEINSIAIVDFLGKQLFSKKVAPNELNIDVSSFKSGIYFIKISSKNGKVVLKKLIKN